MTRLGAATAAVLPAGSIGLRLVDVPIDERNDPRARIYLIDRVAPGTSIRRRVEATNTSATAGISLYAAAASVAGGSFLGAAGHTGNDLSTWTSVLPNASGVGGARLLTASVTIAVPRDAAPGERYGVIWAEARSTPIVGGGVTQVSRVGIRMYLSVGRGAAPAANFTIESLTAARSRNGQPTVVAAVHNTGGRALDVSGTLRLSDGPSGLSAGPFPAVLGVTVAVGGTEPVSIALDKGLPVGPWVARLTLHSGLLVRSARATIRFPRSGTMPPVIANSGATAWSPARTAIVLGMLGAAAVSAVLWRLPRRSTKRRLRPRR